MSIKKRLRSIVSSFLTMGASLTIGLLSFGGILAIIPSLPFALAGFILSVAYEGEIYLQNMKSALKKLFKSSYLERQLAKECLRDEIDGELNRNSPGFFKDYKALLHQKNPNKKQLADMEKWFAEQLFSTTQALSPYQANLRHKLEQAVDGRQSIKQIWRDKLLARQGYFNAIKLFCIVAGSFMSVGTSYLLVDTFLSIPLLAALPATLVPILIVPMALIAGAAYGLLIYNAATDMLGNDTFNKWSIRIKEDIEQRRFLMPVVLGVMLTISVALSVCTAGTWWTVAKTVRPLFDWMGKMPSFIMYVLNPLISSLSIFIFNIQNVVETLEMVDPGEEVAPAPIAPLPVAASKPNNENWLQQLNPFRLLIALTFTPLRLLLFLGHLISIGVTADRVPGVPPILSALLGIISEAVEDAHYFISQLISRISHQHNTSTRALMNERLDLGAGHNHDDDLPTQFLKGMYHILYVPAAIWDSAFSQFNDDEHVLDFWSALDKQRGTVTSDASDEALACCNQLSDAPLTQPFSFAKQNKSTRVSAWEYEHAAYRIERYKIKHLQEENAETATAVAELSNIQKELLEYPLSADFKLGLLKPVKSIIRPHLDVSQQPANRHRFFAAETQTFLDELPNRVSRAMGV